MASYHPPRIKLEYVAMEMGYKSVCTYPCVSMCVCVCVRVCVCVCTCMCVDV